MRLSTNLFLTKKWPAWAQLYKTNEKVQQKTICSGPKWPKSDKTNTKRRKGEAFQKAKIETKWKFTCKVTTYLNPGKE